MMLGTGSYYSSGGRRLSQTIDWWIVAVYLALVLFGWMNIYASIQNFAPPSIFDMGYRSGKQFLWICLSLGSAAAIVLLIPPQKYESWAPFIYLITLILLVAVIFLSNDIKGSRSWFSIGQFRFQPAEISKMATSLMLATAISHSGFRMERTRDLLIAAGIILLPMLIIILEKETGSALVYIGFIFMLYREGLSGWLIALVGLAILLFILTITVSPFVSLLVLLVLVSLYDAVFTGKLKWYLLAAVPSVVGICFIPTRWNFIVTLVLSIGYAIWSVWYAIRGVRQKFRLATVSVLIGGLLFILSADFIFDNVLKDYQRARIEVLLGMVEDNSGAGYNVNQSKIAIGSGGFSGKGFCEGTQTAYGFVPEQSTDFIFCTVGEEWGFLGCVFVIGLYVLLICRIIRDSEHSRSTFTRVYGYCLAGCFFMHLFINIGMTLGLMPVIGIPLPFMSYGGSSMLAFTIMLFIFVALDRNERKYF